MKPHTLTMMVLLVSGAASTAAAELNTAPQAELESVKGIGPDLSQRILDLRRERAFSDWEDVMRRVKGVGKATARRWSQEGLTVQGRPYDPLPPTSAASAASR
jgi:competence protein ComEA